ncbi:MAG: zinc-dependent metalloprotease family protein [Chloroflexota bacterium]
MHTAGTGNARINQSKQQTVVLISENGFNPESFEVIPNSQIIWQNTTSQTITMTYGLPPSAYLPIILQADQTKKAPTPQPTFELRGSSHPTPPPPTPSPPVERNFIVHPNQAYTQTMSTASSGEVHFWYSEQIDASVIVKIISPTPTPTATSTETPLPTPWENGDDDNDRLSNGAETNTGQFVGLSNTGTDPNNPDTDGDGLSDGDEVLGTADGLLLDLMGANPNKKDLLLEFDWFDDNSLGLNASQTDCGFHSHKPTPLMLERLRIAYADAPINNPDGTTGINLIADTGEAWPLDQGQLIPDGDGVLVGEIDDEQHNQIKATYFEQNRRGYFHYVLMIHEYRRNPTQVNGSSGLAEVGGDDVLVSMGCLVGSNYDAFTSSTVMHEVGHNLGLRHGGPADKCNYKPNHNSIMNYRYQFRGLDTTCDGLGDGFGLAGRGPLSNVAETMSYSDGSRLDLDENSLDERVGMCGEFIDWNKNFIQNIIQTPFDVNRYRPDNQAFSYSASLEAAECGGEFTVLRDYNEWELLDLALFTTESRRPQELIYEVPIFEILPGGALYESSE